LSVSPPRDAPDIQFPASPCINVCQLDGHGVCVGCRRTVAEIAQWPTMSAEEQWRVVRALPERQPVSLADLPLRE
jgi:hypothetical protein